MGHYRLCNVTERTNLLDGTLSEMYDYDNLNRLVSSDRADDFDQTWTLDGSGNFSAFDDDGSSQTRSTDAANQIAAVTGGWITPAYDGAGNMISGPKPGEATTRVHYVYDAWNRLVAVKADDPGNPGQPGDTMAQYTSDGLNRRVKKTDEYGWGDHYYYNQHWQVLEDREVDDLEEVQAVNDYVWSPDYIDTPMVCLRDGDLDGTVTNHYPGDWSRYYLTDANHNVTTTIRYDNDYDEIADVTTNVYTPYGVVMSRTGSDAAFDGPLYCGYFYDVATGLYQVRNRYYDPGLSTWISRDPILYTAHDASLYRYCANRPTICVDPSGKNLADEICNLYVRRGALGALILPQLYTRPEDWLRHFHEFYDDGHVRTSSRSARDEYLVGLAKDLGVTPDGKWWTISTNSWRSIYPIAKTRFFMREDPALSWIRQASFWLGGMHDFEAKGAYTIRLCRDPNHPNSPIAEIRNVRMSWRWVDDIDAHSFSEPGGSILEGIVDIVWDKLLSGDFWIHVNFRDTEGRSLRILPTGDPVPEGDPPPDEYHYTPGPPPYPCGPTTDPGPNQPQGRSYPQEPCPTVGL